MSTHHGTLASVTQRICERSKPERSAYLRQLEREVGAVAQFAGEVSDAIVGVGTVTEHRRHTFLSGASSRRDRDAKITLRTVSPGAVCPTGGITAETLRDFINSTGPHN